MGDARTFEQPWRRFDGWRVGQSATPAPANGRWFGRQLARGVGRTTLPGVERLGREQDPRLGLIRTRILHRVAGCNVGDAR